MFRFHHFTRGLFAVHFYFHTETDVRTTDTDGQEFATYGEARVEAIRTCGQLMKDAPEVFWGSRPWSVTVTDKSGFILWEYTSMDRPHLPRGTQSRRHQRRIRQRTSSGS